jgi:hypothetical protein
MKPEEKLDRIIKEVVSTGLVEHPSPAFTDNVLEKLGFRKVTAKSISNPILSKWAKIAITIGYISIIALFMIFSKGQPSSPSRYLDFTRWLQLPSLTSILGFNSQFYNILLVLIGAGWLLIFIDGFIKKTMTR